jgi:hypothetical protein
LALPTDYLGQARNFFESQRVEAQRLFLGMMASEWKDRLCKCRYQYCGRYFLHPKPRQCYRRGTLCCREHASSAAAAESMQLARIRGRETLIDAAAQMLCSLRIKGPAWQADPDIKRRLASDLCRVISRERLSSYQQDVKANWVSRHQETIERRRRELSGR